jgi:tetratricopeptide (TPR) repeat protein
MEDQLDAEELYTQGLELYKDGAPKDAAGPLKQALDAFLAQANETRAATVANDLGVVYYVIGQRDDARQYFDQARVIFEEKGDLVGQAKALGNLAQLMNRCGDKAGAEKNYERAADLFRQAKEPAFEFDTYRAYSIMLLRQGRWIESMAAYDRGLAAKGGSGFLRALLSIPLRLFGARR